jgi:hypothetical protein
MTRNGGDDAGPNVTSADADAADTDADTDADAADADADTDADAARTARVETRHDAPGLVAGAIRPDNTESMRTTVHGDRVRTTIERETTGGLGSSVDDYVVNLRVADRIVGDARARARARTRDDDDGPRTDDSARVDDPNGTDGGDGADEEADEVDEFEEGGDAESANSATNDTDANADSDTTSTP